MWCSICRNPLATCVCPDLKERIAIANEHPNVFIKTCAVCGEHHARCKCLKFGARAIIHEDGLMDLVEILEDTSGPGKKEYNLRHVKHLNHDACGIETATDFHVMQRTDVGAWGGMWELEAAPLDEEPQS